MNLSELVDVSRVKELVAQRERIRVSIRDLKEAGVNEAVNTRTGRSYAITSDLTELFVDALLAGLKTRGEAIDKELLTFGVNIDLPLEETQAQMEIPLDAGPDAPPRIMPECWSLKSKSTQDWVTFGPKIISSETKETQ